MRLEVIARKAGIPYLEYASMPIGELSDFIDFYAESEGGCKIVSKIDTEFIPLEVR